MSEELEIEGVSYVSSKRAAQISGYTRDYIGQLCRAGVVQAQRIGGLWYINIDSLYQHKKKADSYVPTVPRVPTNEASAFISLDGKDYISASRAAEITGYHKDYVGQLAREGSVLSRQVGNRWYVDRGSISAHKREKDALLADVQREAVGLARPAPREGKSGLRSTSDVTDAAELMKYTSDDRELLPILKDPSPPLSTSIASGVSRSENVVAESGYFSGDTWNSIPIRLQNPESRATMEDFDLDRGLFQRQKRQKGLQAGVLVAGIATIVVVLTLGVTILKDKGVYLTDNDVPRAEMTGLAALAYDVTSKIGSTLERWLVPELVYKYSAPNQ